MTTPEIIAGTDSDFMTVPHLTARGSQIEIGRQQAEQARRVYDWQPVPADPVMARARRVWFARYWPQHLARMQGAADLLGIDLQASRKRLEAIDWVEWATVERRLPDTLYVTLKERRAVAIWQNGTEYTLIDANGRTVRASRMPPGAAGSD